jgi:hypothetical protein
MRDDRYWSDCLWDRLGRAVHVACANASRGELDERAVATTALKRKQTRCHGDGNNAFHRHALQL